MSTTESPGNEKRSAQPVKPAPEAFFYQILGLYQAAELAVDKGVDHYYRLAGHTIRLRFAGETLVPQLTPALDHLQTNPMAKVDLTICIWDSESTGVAWPNLPWFAYTVHENNKGQAIQNLYTPRGDVRGYNDGRINMHVGDKLFSLLDLERNIAIYWCQDAAALPIYERGAPLRSIFHWWLRHQGLQMIHAGAVGDKNGAVLLAGKGGSGKSTTALTCLNSDLSFISDDYSLLSTGSDPYVYTLYNTAKVRADNLPRVPHLRHALTNAGRLDVEKALFFIQQHYPEKIVSRLPIRAILLPRLAGGQDTTIEPAARRDALSALTLSTLHQLAGSGKDLLVAINDLVTHVPSYYLNLGRDLPQIPQVITHLLREGHS